MAAGRKKYCCERAKQLMPSALDAGVKLAFGGLTVAPLN
jgi:hypothetical protein